MRVPALALSLAALVTAAALGAQCPDGTPPPCATGRATRAPDANRMLILPFRVSTTDTLLGEGFAELLASEFTREGMPQAVDMATTLGSWRAAGGRLRAPLTRDGATRLARSLGAGLVSDGSIVGLGKQITITVALINSTSGQPRTATLRITGSADSLEVSLKRTTSAIMEALAPQGAVRAAPGGQYTSSPEAMLAYLEGLALWRRGHNNAAALRWDRAIALDSTFAQAVYRRANAATWAVPGPPVESYSELEWKLRDRLSPGERLVIETLHAAGDPATRSAAEVARGLDHAAAVLPDSPEVLYEAGDMWYHFGVFIDRSVQWQRAKDYFMRSVAIDSQPVILGHLIELGIHTFDTMLVRASLRGYRAVTDSTLFARKWFGAASIGDNATLASLRTEGLVAFAQSPVGGLAWFADMPASTLDEFFDRWGNAMTPARVPLLRRFYANVLMARGRPDAAMRIRESLPDTGRARLDAELLLLAVSGVPTGGVAVDEIAQRVARGQHGDSSNAAERCAVLLWKRGAVTTADSANLRADRRCRWALDVLTLPADGSAATLDRIARADSQMRVGFLRPYEPYIVAHAWEANGQPARALSTVRIREVSSGTGVSYHPWTLAYEGKLAAQLGDTTGALFAYRKWLGMMRDAEPPFAGARDSVRAEVARLARPPR